MYAQCDGQNHTCTRSEIIAHLFFNFSQFSRLKFLQAPQNANLVSLYENLPLRRLINFMHISLSLGAQWTATKTITLCVQEYNTRSPKINHFDRNVDANSRKVFLYGHSIESRIIRRPLSSSTRKKATLDIYNPAPLIHLESTSSNTNTNALSAATCKRHTICVSKSTHTNCVAAIQINIHIPYFFSVKIFPVPVC